MTLPNTKQLIVGKTYVVENYPFVRSSYTEFSEDGGSEVECWAPGVEYEQTQYGSDMVYDEFGSMELTLVDVHKPGSFPTRVFYTRKFVDPDGKRFGKNKLHIRSIQHFRKIMAVHYEYLSGQKLIKRHGASA